jgi:thiamine biosynthesis lipoprotein
LRKSSKLLLCLPLIAASVEIQRFERVEPHMGTLFRITVYAPDIDVAHAAFNAAFARVHQLDEILSDYNPASELMRLSTRPTHVSEDLFRVLEASQALAAETDGAFDITLGPVIRLWRKARRDKVLPTSEAINAALHLTGYRKLVLDRTNRTASLTQPGMQLDVGGIAKGYAADEALKVLRAHGISESLVAASGDLRIGSRSMTVEVEPAQGVGRKLLLSNAAVSTSGDTEQFVELAGKRYSHIVDPKTGLGLTSRIGVTIIAPDGITADSLATAVCVMGADRGREFIKHLPDVSALIATEGKVIAVTGLFAPSSNSRE